MLITFFGKTVGKLEFFSQNYINEKAKALKPHNALITKLGLAEEKIESDRKKELDALERKYSGRLEGEIFKEQKELLNIKYLEKMSSLENELYTEKRSLVSFEDEIKKELNRYLQENGFSFSNVPEFATIDGEAIFRGDFYQFKSNDDLQGLIDIHKDLIDHVLDNIGDFRKKITGKK